MSYEKLEKTFYRLAQLEHANAMLSWDQAVMMPPRSNEARGRALAELEVLATEIMQDPRVLDDIEVARAGGDSLDPWQQANLAEMARAVKSANAIPADLVEAIALATSSCEHAWRSLRPENDWKSFEPLLQTVFDLNREKAQALFDGLNDEKQYAGSYEALLDIYDPGTRLSVVDPVFTELRNALPALLQQVLEKQRVEGPPEVPEGPIKKGQQIDLGRELMATLGFDFDAGRLDETAHPFSGGVSDDSRVTSRYDEANPIEGIMAIIHETGHSRYETGLPESWRFRPVGRSMGMGVHESQSLFFEMQLGRSKPFLDAIAPLIGRHLGQAELFTGDNLLKLYTEVKPGLIRVNADEVTYPLHVILRYEIERDVIQGDAAVADIPDRWNEAMAHYFGLDTRGNYGDGPMQDIHWSIGAIGYFPSYTLGAINAAQFYQALSRDIPDVSELVARLELQPVFEWLSEHVWSKGRLLSYDELMLKATGETLNHRYFLDHLQARYLS